MAGAAGGAATGAVVGSGAELTDSDLDAAGAALTAFGADGVHAAVAGADSRARRGRL